MFVFICLLFLGIFLQEQDCVSDIKFIATIDNSEEKISLFKNEEAYYLFLPSYAEFENLKIEYPIGCSVYIDDIYYDSSISCSSLSANSEHTLLITNSFGMTILKERLMILKTKNIATMSIKLTNGTVNDLNKDKSTEMTGTCKVISADGNLEYSGSFDKINGRGGYTWSQEKKPYNISFTQDVNLLGLGSAKNWILLANALDASNLRNKIVYDAAKKLGLANSLDSDFVDLYVNDEYYGLYLLTEKIEIDTNRIDISDLSEETQSANNAKLNSFDAVEYENDTIYKKYYNIPNNPDDISGGYVIELQHWDSRYIQKSAFATQNKNCFSLKSLPYATEKQIDYISNYIQEVENSIINGNFDEYIDINSWVKYYLIQEIFGNMDTRSFFYYKDKNSVDANLYAGPVWDFDVSMGNHSVGPEINPQAFYINTWGWFSYLYSDDDFNKQVKVIYESEAKNLLNEIIDTTIYEYGEIIEASYTMNYYRWLNIQDTNRSDDFTELSEHIEYLREYLISRQTFLDDVWINNLNVFSICATSKAADYEYTHKYYYTVSPGSEFNNLPVLSKDNYTFLGWYNVETMEEYVPGEIITSNKEYEAKWVANAESTNENSNISIIDTVKRIIINNSSLLFALFLFGMIILSICFFVLKDLKSKKSRTGNKNE